MGIRDIAKRGREAVKPPPPPVKTEEANLDASIGPFQMPAVNPAQAADLKAAVAKMYEPGGQLAYVPEALKKQEAADAFNERFGGDQAWLDKIFQQDPALLGTSARSLAEADPKSIEAQQKALDSLFGVAKDGGASAQERARRAGARGDSEDWLRGQREADMENLAERGMSGSGAELLTLAKDRQDAAGRNSKADLETDAWLEQRALDAMQGAGELGGKMRNSSFDEAYKRGEGQDDFYKLNADATNKVKGENIQWLRDSMTHMQDKDFDWQKFMTDLKVRTAGGLMDSDVKQGAAGFGQASQVGTGDVASVNAGIKDQNTALGAPVAGQHEAEDAAFGAGALSRQGEEGIVGTTGQAWVDAMMTGAGSGPGAGGGGAAASGGGALQTGSGGTWGSSGAAGQYGSAPTVGDVATVAGSKDEEE